MFGFDVVTSYQERFDSETDELLPGESIAQELYAHHNSLYRIELHLCSSNTTPSGTFKFTLRRGEHHHHDSSSQPIRIVQVDASRFIASGVYSFEFPEIHHSLGQLFTITLTSIDGRGLRLKKLSNLGNYLFSNNERQTGALWYKAIAIRNRAMYDNFQEFRSSLGRTTTTVQHTPIMIRAEISKACNQQCIMCVHGDAGFRKTLMGQKFLSLQKFASVTPLLKRATDLVAFGLGEPFLNPDFLPILHHTKKTNPFIRVTVSTNATLLSAELINEIIEHKLIDVLQISIDGASESTYATVRKRKAHGNDYSKVIEALCKVIETRATRQAHHLQIITEMLIMPQTVRDITPYVQQMIDLGVDVVFFDSVKGEYPHLKLSNHQILLEAALQIERCKEIVKGKRLLLSGPFMEELPVLLSRSQYELEQASA